MLTSRDIAFSSLLKCEKRGSYPNIEIDSAIEKNEITGPDRAFYTALVYGTIERKLTLDYIISLYSAREVTKIDDEILVILRMGIYQILYMGGVPDHAACNECVELCRKAGKKSAVGFVNALLREVVRRKDEIPFPDRSEGAKYLSVCYSYPEWLCEMWIEDYGFERCESLLCSLNDPPDVTLRVNRLKNTVNAVLDELSEKNIKVEKGIYSPDAVRLLQPYPVASLDMLKDGRVFVQDEASQLCSAILGAKRGETIVDTCSCPGGKSFSIALNMENEGKVYSLDLHANKLSLVKKGADRLGLSIIETMQHDGKKACRSLIGCADRVLVDAPCSGLGVIAKKPDLRYKQRRSVEGLPEVQYSILDSACQYLKKNGVLVYSTCTVNKRENDEVVKRFLEEHKEFTVYDFDLGSGISSENGMLTFYPDTFKTDGFFVSRFVKKA